MRSVAILAIAIALAAGPAFAKNDKAERHDKNVTSVEKKATSAEKKATSVNVDIRIGEPQRVIVRDYYLGEFKGGHCPPGLAKKNNGCLPPGQAKKYRVGHPLPRDVIFYELPRPLIAQLGAAPPGHRYVRVANDVLLLRAADGRVLDVIANFGRS